jgi:polyribonucleotide nucleotidyltransferase
MAATCGSTLALLDAGVPIKSPVTGIAMGLMTKSKAGPKPDVEFVKEDDKYYFAVLTDLQGLEDFGGDMDFKIDGTREGITAIQLDVKIDGLSLEMIRETIDRAKAGRLKIMDKVEEVIAKPRTEISSYAPRVTKMQIDPTRIGELIGPGGKNVQNIITQAGGKDLVAVDIEDDGTVLISSADSQAAKIAEDLIQGQFTEAEVGAVYEGAVVNIQTDRNSGKEIGAIVEILPGKTGMVHISEVAPKRIDKVSDELSVGQTVKVKVLSIDRERGRVALSIKQNGSAGGGE